MSKKVGIIQARMGSSRLPLKMMLSLHGKPIMDWVVTRVLKSSLDEVIVAIPDTQENDILEKNLKKFGIIIFRGDEKNVLKRFYGALADIAPAQIVRICADNPLIDPLEIDNLLDFYNSNVCDYAYNHIPRNNLYADGFGAEIISYELFCHIYNVATKDEHKEHCLSYIWDNQDKFKIKTFNPQDRFLCRPDLKFDIDTFQDYYKLSMKNFGIDATSKELIEIFGE